MVLSDCNEDHLIGKEDTKAYPVSYDSETVSYDTGDNNNKATVTEIPALLSASGTNTTNILLSSKS